MLLVVYVMKVYDVKASFLGFLLFSGAAVVIGRLPSSFGGEPHVFFYINTGHYLADFAIILCAIIALGFVAGSLVRLFYSPINQKGHLLFCGLVALTALFNSLPTDPRWDPYSVKHAALVLTIISVISLASTIGVALSTKIAAGPSSKRQKLEARGESPA